MSRGQRQALRDQGRRVGCRYEQSATAAAGDQVIRDGRDLPVARRSIPEKGPSYMSMKRVVRAAAVAAGLGISAITLTPGFAGSAPLDPPPPCPNCHGGGGGGGGNPGSPGGAPRRGAGAR